MSERDAPPTDRPRGLQLHTQILIGLVLGSLIALGAKSFLVGPGLPFAARADLLDFGQRWIQPVGDLFIRVIILTVVPLVFTSITTGVYSLGDLRALGRLGGRTIVIFLSTAFLGACIATGLYLLFDPGSTISEATREQLTASFLDTAEGKREAASDAATYFSGSPLQILVSLVPSNITLAMTSNRDLLKVILFAMIFGVSLTMIPKDRAAPVAAVLEGVNEAMTKIIGIMMKMAPYGVFALVFMVVTRFGTEILLALALYTSVVLLALAAHLAIILAPLLRFVAKRKPIEFLRKSREIWITAFSTSSSSATLPTTMRVAEEQLDVPRPIASFVLPLGATINMDGTTIYQIIAVHFVAQVWGVPLDAATMLTLIVVAMLMAIGAAGVPGGVIPLLYVVMATVGIPEVVIPMGIALILGMDRILDMCRSALNVIGDTTTAAVVADLERRQA